MTAVESARSSPQAHVDRGAAPVRHLSADALESKRKQHLFAFEKSREERKQWKKTRWAGGSSLRPANAANTERDALIHRLALDDQGAHQLEGIVKDDPELQRLLLRWASDLPLNIVWYQDALARTRRRHKLYVGLTVSLAILAIAAVAGLALAKGWLGGMAEAASAQVTFVASAVFLAMQVVARTTDVRAQIAGFWEASANLKEAVYRIEEEWAGHVWDVPEVIRFKTALKENLRLARDETHKERSGFFRTLQSPAEVIESATGALAALQGKRDAFVKARDAALAAQRAELAAQEAAASPEAQKGLQLRVEMEVRARKLEAARRERSHLLDVHDNEKRTPVAKREVTDKMLADAETKVADAEAALAAIRDELVRHLTRAP